MDRNIKLCIGLFIGIFSCISTYSNEKKVCDATGYSFKINYSGINDCITDMNDVMNTSAPGICNFGYSKGNYARWSENMFWLGIAGCIVGCIGFTMIVIGAPLLAYGWYYWPGYYYGTYFGLYAAGCSLLGIGLFLFCAGICMLIPGFILYAVFKKKAGISYETDCENPSVSMALAIQL
jgi:hypothetical protein